jgi:DNA-binding HxlR family transcriptional regulator/peroxiredoxin
VIGCHRSLLLIRSAFLLGTYYIHRLMRQYELADTECAIAHAAAIVGDWWSLLIVRDVAGGMHRFDDLQAELRISRKVLTERLASLLAHGVLEKRLYQLRPPRYEYHLTTVGRGLVPVLVALQDWGSRYVMGEGTLSATSAARSLDARRVRHLVGRHVPQLTLSDAGGSGRDPVSAEGWTVLYCYPGAYASSDAYPVGWGEIPGAAGCTLESTTFRDRCDEFVRRGAHVVGVSTQRPEEQATFAAKARVRFPLLSDQDLQLAAALRLPTFRAGGRDRLKRLTLIVGSDRAIRHALYPVADPVGSVDDALTALDRLQRRHSSAATVRASKRA